MQLKLKQPGNEVWNKVNKVPCLVTNNKRTRKRGHSGQCLLLSPGGRTGRQGPVGGGVSMWAGTLTPGPSTSTPYSEARYKLPGADLTNDHRRGGLKNRSVFPQRSGSHESEFKV